MKVYRYFTGKDDVHFCARVTKALNEGYSLYGSPTMTFNGSEVIVGQVVVKDVEDESEVPQGLKDALAQQQNSWNRKKRPPSYSVLCMTYG